MFLYTWNFILMRTQLGERENQFMEKISFTNPKQICIRDGSRGRANTCV